MMIMRFYAIFDLKYTGTFDQEPTMIDMTNNRAHEANKSSIIDIKMTKVVRSISMNKHKSGSSTGNGMYPPIESPRKATYSKSKSRSRLRQKHSGDTDNSRNINHKAIHPMAAPKSFSSSMVTSPTRPSPKTITNNRNKFPSRVRISTDNNKYDNDYAVPPKTKSFSPKRRKVPPPSLEAPNMRKYGSGGSDDPDQQSDSTSNENPEYTTTMDGSTLMDIHREATQLSHTATHNTIHSEDPFNHFNPANPGSTFQHSYLYEHSQIGVGRLQNSQSPQFASNNRSRPQSVHHQRANASPVAAFPPTATSAAHSPQTFLGTPFIPFACHFIFFCVISYI